MLARKNKTFSTQFLCIYWACGVAFDLLATALQTAADLAEKAGAVSLKMLICRNVFQFLEGWKTNMDIHKKHPA